MPDRDREIMQIYENLFSSRNPPSLLKYDILILQARDIFKERNNIYGDSFKETGVYGTLAVLAGDVSRLKNIIYKIQDPDERTIETVRDKLLDVINQAVITLMMVEDNNWTGEEDEHNGE